MKKVFKTIGKIAKWCACALLLIYGVFFCGGMVTAMYDVATNDSLNVSRDTIKSSVVGNYPKEKKHNGRCLARTEDGTMCKRKAKDGYYYCWQHLKYYK